MPIARAKSALWKRYRQFKYWPGWQKNGLTRLIYKLFKLALKPLIWLVILKREIMHQVYRFQPLRKLRRNMNRKGINLLLARRAGRLHHWKAAKRYYQKVWALVDGQPGETVAQNESRLNISVIERVLNPSSYQTAIREYQSQRKKVAPKNRIAIVTAVSGGYDSMRLPAVLDPAFDYIFYTDMPVSNGGIYDVRPLPYFHYDTTRMARYVKTNLHLLVPEYDTVIWLDANIMIMDDIMPLIKTFKASGKAVAAVPHPDRTSVYEEAEACKQLGKSDGAQIDEQVEHLRSLKYDCDGLIESSFMMFRMNDKRIPGFFTTWWAELDRYTRRDQLSLNYALDTNGIDYHRLTERPLDIRRHPKFTIVAHDVEQSSIKALEEALHYPVIDPYAGPSFAEKRTEILAGQADAKLKIDVVYCVHNALEDVQRCLEAVVRYRTKNVRLIIIDDGSDTPTADYLKSFQAEHKAWVELHRKSTGSGYTRAANRGLKKSKGDFVILLNSDTIVTDGWTDKLAHALYSTPGAGIVGPMSSAAGSQSLPDHKSRDNQTATNPLPIGLKPDDMNRYCEEWSVAGQYPLVPLIHGFCFGLKREVIKQVGYFDEKKFPRGYGEENDYCFRATAAGFRLVLATNTYIFHAKSKSYQNEERIQIMKAGGQQVTADHGRKRVWRDVMTMENHPQLMAMRAKAAEVYARFS